MVLSVSEKDLKIKQNNRLHIRRRPTLFSWLLLFLSVVFFNEIFRLLTDNFFLAVVASIGQTMFALDAFARWENLTLDKEKNAVIASQYKWSDKLMARSPENTTIMKLSDVCHVGVSVNMGLFFVCDDGKTIGLDTRGLTRDEIQNHRKLINHFISMKNNVNSLGQRSLDKNSVLHHQNLNSNIFRSTNAIIECVK